MPIFKVEVSHTIYAKADSAEEAVAIAIDQYRYTEPNFDTERVRPGDYVDPDWKNEAPCSKRGDLDYRDIAELLEEERERMKEGPTAEELEAVGQLILEQNQ